MSGPWSWEHLAWCDSAADQALGALWRSMGGGDRRSTPVSLAGAAGPQERISHAARSLGMRAEEVSVRYRDIEWFLRRGGPALIPIPGEDRILAIAGTYLGRVCVVAPDGRNARIRVNAMAHALRAPLLVDVEGTAADWLDRAGVRGRRRMRAQRWMVLNEVGAREALRAWHVEPGEDSGWRAHFRDLAWSRRLARVLGANALAYFLWLPAWGLLAWMSFGDRLGTGWWLGWLLICLSMFPLRVYSLLSAQLLATDLIARVRQRLLAASARLDPDRVRHLGVGSILGVTLEVSEVSSFLQIGALDALTSLVEVGVITALLFTTAGPGFGLSLLMALALTFGIGWLHYCCAAAWIDGRMDMTHDDVERMVGHRTRTIQEQPAEWHIEEDSALERYLSLSQRMDRLHVLLRDVIPRGWFVLSFAGLFALLAAGTASPAVLAGGALGAILGWRSLRTLATALTEASQAIVGWQRVRLFLEARAPGEQPGDPKLAYSTPASVLRADKGPLLEARGIQFSYPGRTQAVLRNASLRIGHRDRIRLEGVSGGGKSTLASLLAQANTPTAGLVLLQGVDVGTVGSAEWRRRVVLVPQFHDNHVLMGSFAFNMLMGRGWPPISQDLEEAEDICRSLGLGPLIDRMPAGMLQIVGETGWQLSHGERTRLYIARALAQRPEVLILDESLAALDPESVRLTAAHLEAQEAALVLIAHP